MNVTKHCQYALAGLLFVVGLVLALSIEAMI